MASLVEDPNIGLCGYTSNRFKVPAQFESQISIENCRVFTIRPKSKIVFGHARCCKSIVDFVTARLRNGIVLRQAFKPQPASIRGIVIQNRIGTIKFFVRFCHFIRMVNEGHQFTKG